MTDAGGRPLGVRPDPRASLSFGSLSLRLQMKVVLNLLAPEQLDTSHYPESKSPLVSALGSGLLGVGSTFRLNSVIGPTGMSPPHRNLMSGLDADAVS
jgi:hypothetical protein